MILYQFNYHDSAGLSRNAIKRRIRSGDTLRNNPDSHNWDSNYKISLYAIYTHFSTVVYEVTVEGSYLKGSRSTVKRRRND